MPLLQEAEGAMMWFKRFLKPAGKWDFTPLPTQRLEFTEDERMLFSLLPESERVAFAQSYFNAYLEQPTGILNREYAEFPDIRGLVNVNA
jgi:hypothetical protein